jgi:preprotein translocase subunit SecG
MSILIYIATFALILVSIFLILIVLAQKSTSDGGMGAAMGGGMAEAAFGAQTDSVLGKATINASIAFFVLSFAIYLGHVYQHKHAGAAEGALPNLSGPTLPGNPPAAPSNAAPAPGAPANK